MASNPACPPTCSNATFIEVVDQRTPSNDPSEYRIDPDLRAHALAGARPRAQHDLGHEMSVGVRYVHKQVDRAIEDQGRLVGTDIVYYITNPGFGLGQQLVPGLPDQPKAVRDYDAVELDFRKRLNDRWSFWGRYWWSRLHGNYSGLASSDEVYTYDDDFGPGQTRRARTSPNVNRDFDDLAMSFAENAVPSYGPLPADRPHQLRLQALYDFPFGTSVGATFNAASGVPVSRYVTLPPGVAPVYYLGPRQRRSHARPLAGGPLPPARRSSSPTACASSSAPTSSTSSTPTPRPCAGTPRRRRRCRSPPRSTWRREHRRGDRGERRAPRPALPAAAGLPAPAQHPSAARLTF